MSKSWTQCQEVKNTPSIANSTRALPWQRIHIDSAGLFQRQMFLIVDDSHPKWPEALPMRKSMADATVFELQ